MASQYQHRQFFRRVPNSLLARYFENRKIGPGMKLSKLEDTDVESFFDTLTALPAEKLAAITVDFQNINALANEGGISALVNEAMFFEEDTFLEQITAVDGFHAKSMWAFLDKPEYWKAASSLLHADNVSLHFWKKLNDLPHIPPHVDDADIQQLEQGISRYFYQTEGRGRNCKVEPYRKVETGKEYFFAYPEDYGQADVEWEDDSLATRSRHPAFEIIFVYSQAEGSLDIYAPRNPKAVPELQRIFAKSILNLHTLPDGTIDKRVYVLNPLADPDSTFRVPPGSGIKDVMVTLLRIDLEHGPKRRLVLSADTRRNPMAVYDLLKEVDPPAYTVSQVKIKAVFEAQPGIRARTRTFTVTSPNLCNLGHEGRDAMLRRMLADSDIEPQLPVDEEDA